MVANTFHCATHTFQMRHKYVAGIRYMKRNVAPTACNEQAEEAN